MKISKLLENIASHSLPSPLSDQMVEKLVNDSRQISSKCVFLAIRGINSHALEHLTNEQCQLATAIIYEPDFDITPFGNYKEKFIPIFQLHRHIGLIAKRFYQPVFSRTLIGVTGTNGKTSVTQFIAQLANYACIGTTGYGRPSALKELSHTTPDALLLQKILKELSNNVEGVAMEVSSHALCLNRVDSVDFPIAIFTNLTQDHLDFHTDMEEYFLAKARLFEKESTQIAIINTDDIYGLRLAKQCLQKGKHVIAFGKHFDNTPFHETVQIRQMTLSQHGINAELTLALKGGCLDLSLHSSLWGMFNLYNLLGAILALYAAGEDIQQLITQASGIKGAKGRIERIDLGNQATVIIDYAHTPDALKSTLISLREHMQAQTKSLTENRSGKIYTVFGCGGDRDTTKRPLMAEAVNEYSDFGIITDDNPRTENREEIFEDILAGNIERIRFQVIPSRREAIEFGLSRLSSNDVLLIAGKGHENYQIIGTEKVYFSDHDVVQEYIK